MNASRLASIPLFDDETNHVGICAVSFLEFEVRPREMGLSDVKTALGRLRRRVRWQGLCPRTPEI